MILFSRVGSNCDKRVKTRDKTVEKIFLSLSAERASETHCVAFHSSNLDDASINELEAANEHDFFVVVGDVVVVARPR